MDVLKFNKYFIEKHWNSLGKLIHNSR